MYATPSYVENKFTSHIYHVLKLDAHEALVALVVAMSVV
jgi:hypothetical protein